ncbi:hypothetical protein RNJ44_03438 [Nakaseomyces bracarensis]|uniref:25S rRNA (uridine-N(3))-methyltransferase BMT5-like domain-containing protein n=1 Tax=Nakaseomyces bracarensis TaxID=273131 RepID=A0ABR4NWX6_9SACH
MARRLKGKGHAKGLKAALLNHQASVKLSKTIKKKEENKLKQKTQLNKNQKAQKLQSANQKFIPFERNETLLLVGEGDLSFARSIVEEDYILPENLIVTSFDNSPTELRLKYPHSFEENYEFLVSENVKIFFQIDATKLIKSFKISKHTPWSKIMGPAWRYKYLQNIMFNFPHTGKGIKDQDRNIMEHQELVFGYFDSAKQLFQLVNSGKKNTEIGHSQGYSLGNDKDQKGNITEEGYGKIILSLFNGEPYDSWSVKILAKNNGLQIERSNKFQWENFKSYNHKRTNSEQDTTKPAKERDARIYIFKKFEKYKKKRTKNESDDEDISE